MAQRLFRLVTAALLVVLGVSTSACSSRHDHQRVYAPGGYYHYPHRPYYGDGHYRHGYRDGYRGGHHRHYSGCGCGHTAVSYHYY